MISIELHILHTTPSAYIYTSSILISDYGIFSSRLAGQRRSTYFERQLDNFDSEAQGTQGWMH